MFAHYLGLPVEYRQELRESYIGASATGKSKIWLNENRSPLPVKPTLDYKQFDDSESIYDVY
jgi:hypothetical protein